MVGPLIRLIHPNVVELAAYVGAGFHNLLVAAVKERHPKEVLKEGEVKSLRVIRIDPEQHRIGLSLRKVDSAAFADKDFKLLTAEFKAEEEQEEGEGAPDASEDAPGESSGENQEA